MADCDSESFILGIDIGTTSIKASLLGKDNRDVIESYRCETEANISNRESNSAEQDVAKIFACLQHVLEQFSSHFLAKVSRIGICGQMHGCMMWKGQSFSKPKANDYFIPSDNVSHLITWEDGRCTNEFLATVPATRTNIPISTGFGCASIFWLQRNRPNFLERFDCAGTIMDFIVCVLCQMVKPCMSLHNAVSWGYFDANNMTWELDLLRSANFPTHLLPVVVEPGTEVGKLQSSFCGVPVGTPVGVGLGDFQCSVLASLSQECDAVLNIGTSCQLAVVVSDTASIVSAGESSCQATNITSEAVQFLPFFQGQKVVTAASLSGGNILATFVKMLTSWFKDLGIEESLPSADEIYRRILACADEKGSTSLQVVPTLWGERHTPDQRGQVSNITSQNISLGDVGLALCRGIVENIQEMMPRDLLHLHGVKRIVCAGSALMRNQVLHRQVEQVFGLPLVLIEHADASTGAAMAALLEEN